MDNLQSDLQKANLDRINHIYESFYFEKAYAEGTYADTPHNRKLGRVGKTYSEAEEDMASQKGKPMQFKLKSAGRYEAESYDGKQIEITQSAKKQPWIVRVDGDEKTKVVTYTEATTFANTTYQGMGGKEEAKPEVVEEQKPKDLPEGAYKRETVDKMDEQSVYSAVAEKVSNLSDRADFTSMDVADYLVTSSPSFRRLLSGGSETILDDMIAFKEREEEEDEF